MTLLTKAPLYILSLLSLQAVAKPSCSIKTTKEIISGNYIPTRAPSSTLFTDTLNFTAASAGDTMSAISIPQNLNGWVGTEQYILMTYGVVRSFNKVTGIRDNILNLNTDNFFGISTNDVRIVYNRFAKRWIFSAESTDPVDFVPRDIMVIVSGSDVITETTPWLAYTIPYADISPGFPAGALDYQQLASDANSIYIVANAFDDVDFTNYVGSSAITISLDSAVNGGPLEYTVFTGLLEDINSQYIPPADNFNTDPTYGYLLNAVVDYNNAPPTGSDQLAFFRISDPGSSSATLTGPLFITVPPFGYADVAPHLGNKYAAEGYLQSGNALMWAPHVRGNFLFAAHDIQLNLDGEGSDTGDRIGVRWYQFDLTGGTGIEAPGTVPTLVQSGTLFDNVSVVNPKFYFNASIMTNKNLDLVISSTVSGEEDYTNVVYAARAATDAPGTLREPVLLTNFENPYNFGPLVQIDVGVLLGQRWGDESSLSPDPINDLELWNTQEHASTNNAWAINVTKLVPVA